YQGQGPGGIPRQVRFFAGPNPGRAIPDRKRSQTTAGPVLDRRAQEGVKVPSREPGGRGRGRFGYSRRAFEYRLEQVGPFQRPDGKSGKVGRQSERSPQQEFLVGKQKESRGRGPQGVGRQADYRP